MSAQSRKKACSESRNLDRCGTPSLAQLDVAFLRLMKKRPRWTLARYQQRARVEVYLRGPVCQT